MRAPFVLALAVPLSACLASHGAAGDGAGVGDDGVGDDGVGDGGDGDGDGDGDGEPRCGGGDPYATALLEERLAFLAADERGGRYPGTPGDLATRQYIAEAFACLGLSPAGDGFEQPFVTSNGLDTANVVGYLPGGDLADEIVVVGAHHDHLGEVDGEVYNGANDNASGVSALLSIAQALSARVTPPRRTIAFVTFGYEEHVGLCEGSERFVAEPPAALPVARAVYMINVDMVGTYADGGLVAYGSVPGSPARTLLEQLLPDYPGLDAELGDTAGQDDSDFQAFCDAGVPYLYFETWDNSCYHEPCDDLERIDLAGLAAIASLAGDLIARLADSGGDLASYAQAGCGA